MQVEGVSLDFLTLIMHEQAFKDYLTSHSFLSLESGLENRLEFRSLHSTVLSLMSKTNDWFIQVMVI